MVQTIESPVLTRQLPAFRRELSPRWLGFVMNMPTLVTFLVVLAYPVIFAAYLSFHEVSLRYLRNGQYPFVGLTNFRQLLADQLFTASIINTLVFSVFSVAVEIVAAIAVALLLSQASVWTSRVTRALILLPFAVPPIANGLIWTFMYDFDGGFLNRILITLGVIGSPIHWLGNPSTALFAVAIPYIWRSLPFCILLVHAALTGISRELYEAAAIDGAGAWRRFWSITLPLLRPVVAVLLVLRTASAVVVFDEILALTEGGPGDATWMAAWYSYRKSFQAPFQMGLGSASAYVLAVLIGLLSLTYIRFIYRRQSEEGR